LGTDLRIAHLYPDLLRTYGDSGNVLCLRKRSEWRGFTVSVQEVSRNERIPDDSRIIFIGGGTDRVQALIGYEMKSRGSELTDAAARGAVVLGVCGGYQLLGNEYVAADGAGTEGMGLFAMTTVASTSRLVGRVEATARFQGETFPLVGFENHGGRTHLENGTRALASVKKGYGNNGQDRSEGAVSGSVVGTYLHGPVLAFNPGFADRLLGIALASQTGGATLARLDDLLEDSS
jgi:CobQ-like glutamine amidotransferase family enzyme